MTRPTPAARLALFFATAVVAGATMPVQGRLNAQFAAESGEPVLASFASFTAGFLVILAVTVLTGRGRRALARVPAALRSGQVRPWHFVAGTAGACVVLAQSGSIGTIGVAVFTVALVTGQLIGGILLDRLGWSPAGVRPLTARRVLGAVLAVAAVALVVWPRLGEAGRLGPGWLLLAAIPLLIGLATSGQQVLNARQAAAYGSVLPATLINFLVGAGVIGLVLVVQAAAAGVHGGLVPQWWLYLGGPLGCVFIGLSAILVPRVGVFTATLGLVSGNLLGSVVVDALAPTGGAQITVLTVVGTCGAVAAAALAGPGRIRAPQADPLQERPTGRDRPAVAAGPDEGPGR
ncbi:DMT family transporter [Micrococcus lylae]|uniref:DMT family transporter n=1 Tax=Micrococcus lylae TaxID=1273 RepID=UPI003EB92DF1